MIECEWMREWIGDFYSNVRLDRLDRLIQFNFEIQAVQSGSIPHFTILVSTTCMLTLVVYMSAVYSIVDE